MRFTPGNTYGQGRPKGSKNKVASEIKEKLSDLSLEALNKLDIETMEAEQLLKFLSYSLSYIMPKLKQVEQETTINANSQNLEILNSISDEELEANFNKIKSRVL
jgi:hypothetical protein